MSDNYVLELDSDQLQLISKSLDFYARIQTGQISELINPYMVPLDNADYTNVAEKVNDLKQSMFPDLPIDAHFSIKSPRMPDTIRQMVDICEVIRYGLLVTYNSTPDTENPISKPRSWSVEKNLPVLKKI
jgi:hypothetical protein